MLKLKINGRLGSRAPDYFDSCRDFYEKFHTSQEQLLACAKTSPKKLHGPETSQLADNADRYWQGSVIFAVATMEAFIYDYAVNSLSATYFGKYLDKLSLKAKWVIVPRLVIGKDLPTGSDAFQHLDDLLKERNDLIHSKSYAIPTDHRERLILLNNKIIVGRMEKRSRLNPYPTVVEMLQELLRLEDDSCPEARWWELEDTDV